MRVALLLLLAMLAGCVRTYVTPLGAPATRPPVSADSVLVYRTAEQVPGKFVEVAELTADGGTVAAGGKLLTALKKRAGELGANAILLLSSETPKSASVTSGYSHVADIESGSYRTKVVAIYMEPVPD